MSKPDTRQDTKSLPALDVTMVLCAPAWDANNQHHSMYRHWVPKFNKHKNLRKGNMSCVNWGPKMSWHSCDRELALHTSTQGMLAVKPALSHEALVGVRS